MEIASYFTDSSTRIPASLTALVVTLISAKILVNLVRKNNAPPGPNGLPILGYLPFFGKAPFRTFSSLREKFGDIFSIQMGSFPAVVINGKTLIKEALVTKGDDFSGRPEFFSNTVLGTESLTFGRFSESSIQHRKIASNCLYVFGNARKNPIEDIVNYEAKMAVSEFSNMNGKPFYPKEIIYSSVGSIIFQICYGKDTNIWKEDKYFRKFMMNTSEFIKFFGSGNPVDTMPFLRFLMPWKVSQFIDIVSQFWSIRQQKVDENMETYSPSHMRHLTDGLITTWKEQEANPESSMSHERIFSTLDDITGAGFETISTTLSWCLLLLTAHPEIQTKVHQEIDQVLGKRQPKLQDKLEMDYCMATINEVLRYGNIVPLAIPHAATKDSELNGYTIRKGTVIIPNMYSISHDKDTWGDPFSFRPERYLDSDGKLDKTITEQFNPFSMGRRKCLGEFLARIELFLFFTGMFQHCKFTKPDNVKEYVFDCTLGLTNSPLPFEVCASMR